MKRIIIQAGHEGRTTGSTGAPSEQSFNIDVSNRVADAMGARGVEVKRVNADPKASDIAGDWDLFLAVHYDADVYGRGGFFVDYPEPSTDGATQESQRIAYLIRQEYGGTTGIINRPERSNANTRHYYMWKEVSLKTPCVIIECGVGMHVPDDHQVLHFERQKVVDGIVKGICLAFNVPFEIQQPTPEVATEASVVDSKHPQTEDVDKDSRIKELESEVKSLEIYVEELEKDANISVDELRGKDSRTAQIKNIVDSRWTWVGIQSGWKKRLASLRELLA